MQRRILTIFGILGALAGIAALLFLLMREPKRANIEVVPARPEQVMPPVEDTIRAVRRSGTLRGKVVSILTEQPIRGATVIALAPHLEKNQDVDATAQPDSLDHLPVWGNLVERRRIKTGKDGTFKLEDLPPDYWNLWVEKKGYAWTTLPRADFKAAGYVIGLGPGCSVYGRVVKPDGKPAPGVRIEYTPQGTHSEVFSRYRLEAYYSTTEEDGSFLYADIPHGPFTIEVYPKEYLPAPWTHEPPLTPGENRDLGIHKLDGGFGMEVSVLWRGTNEPVADIEVVVRPMGDPMPRTKIGQRRTTGADGIARFQGLGGQVMPKPGFLVAANVPGVGPVMSDVPGLLTPNSKVTIYLRKAGVVKGTVLKPDGQPLERFGATLEALDHITRQLQVWGDNGKFKIYQVPEGRYVLHLRSGSYINASVPVTVAGGIETDAGTITLQTGAEVYGAVTRQSGKPLKGIVKVHLARKVKDRTGRDSFEVVARAWVRQDGTYRIRGVPTGTFFIHPESMDEASLTTDPIRIEVPRGTGGVEKNLVLYGTAHLRLKFVDLVEGKELHVRQKPTFLVEERTGKEIAWMTSNMPLRPGRYTVYIELKDEGGVSQRYRWKVVDLQEDGSPDPIEVRLYEIRNGG